MKEINHYIYNNKKMINYHHKELFQYKIHNLIIIIRRNIKINNTI